MSAEGSADNEEEVASTQASSRRIWTPIATVQSTQMSLFSHRLSLVAPRSSAIEDSRENLINATPPAPKKIPLMPRKASQSSRRIQYIKPRGKTQQKELAAKLKKRERPSKNDETLKGESHFMEKLEEHRGKRLQRLCYCELTFSVRVKNIWTVSYYQLKKYLRAVGVVCCPPLCTILNRVAFWPPPRAYFFFRPPEKAARREDSYSDEKRIEEIIQRKKTYTKLKRATRESMEGIWQIGISHACMEDVDGAEGFVLETSRHSFIGCVKVSYSGSARYSMLYSHPSGSDLSDHLLGVPSLKDMARFYRCDIYSYDYSGYGISTGRAGEMNQNADIRALYENMIVARHIHPDKIVVMGYSIGTCASVDLICELQNPPAGLILEAPPLSILRVLTWNRACFGQPWKKKTCCLDRFRTFDKIGNINIPVLVLHGTDDQMVPFQHGKLVHQKAPMAVEPCWMKDVDHDSLENYREVWKRIRTFLKHEVRGSLLSTTSKIKEHSYLELVKKKVEILQKVMETEKRTVSTRNKKKVKEKRKEKSGDKKAPKTKRRSELIVVHNDVVHKKKAKRGLQIRRRPR